MTLTLIQEVMHRCLSSSVVGLVLRQIIGGLVCRRKEGVVLLVDVSQASVERAVLLDGQSGTAKLALGLRSTVHNIRNQERGLGVRIEGQFLQLDAKCLFKSSHI